MNEWIYIYIIWRNSPQWARASSFTRFLDHTQRNTTVGRTPLDEWSARRRDLYLTTHNTHNRQTFMPPEGFEPTMSADGRPQTRGYWDRLGVQRYYTCQIWQQILIKHFCLLINAPACFSLDRLPPSGSSLEFWMNTLWIHGFINSENKTPETSFQNFFIWRKTEI
jgi:hypothetical protein